jgi:hypothetical protein
MISRLFRPSVLTVLRALRGSGAAAALLAAASSAWSATPTFTVANTTFPSTAVGQSSQQNVTLTVNTAVPITSIKIAANFTEYTLGTITGCTVDATGNTVVAAGSVCTIPVTFKPLYPGLAGAPPPIGRSAPLLVTDKEGGAANGYSFALSGSATGQVFAFAPGYLTSVVGNPTFAGGGGTAGCAGQTDINGDGCLATDARIYPTSMALDPAGNLYISDGPLYVVHRVDAVTGIISIFAGKRGVQGPGGSGGPATSATFYNPGAIAVDLAGNVYLDDPVSGLWKINSASGIATLITGNTYTLSQAITEGKPASQTSLSNGGSADSFALLADSAGDIYLASYSTGTVYRIDAVTDLISYVAGNGTVAFPATGVSGGGLAVNARLGRLQALAMDSNGNLYIADGGNDLVYKVAPPVSPASSGIISIFAGTQATSAQYNSGCSYDSGDWGPATSAFVGGPAAVAVDAANNVYLGEPGSQGGQSCPVRRVDAATGIIHTVAGEPPNGPYGFLSGVGATESYLSSDHLAVDGGGNIYVGQVEISAGVSKVSPSQSAIIFPEQSEYVTSDQLVTASNVGVGDDLTLSNYPFPIALVSSTSATPTPLPFTNAPLAGIDPEDCSVGVLAPGAVCGILIAFHPNQATLFTTTVTDTVEANSLGVAGSNVITVSGSAYNGATATLVPNPISFTSQPVGTPTASSLVNFAIFLNPALTYESTTISGPDASSFLLSTPASSPCTTGLAIVAGGGSCNIGVIFNPQSGGTLSATLNVTWLAGGIPYTLSAPISGTGVAAASPVASLTSSLAFPSTTAGATSAALAATLSNTGNAALTGIAPAITGANPSDFALTTGANACGATLAAGSSCSIYVTFTPASATSYAATLSVADNATGSPQTTALSGTGVAALAVATPVIAPGTGTYSSNQSVSITDTTSGATICYTTDSSTPTASNGSCTHGSTYSAAISVTQSGITVQAIGSLSGDTNSAIASATYTLQAAAPTLTPPGGTYSASQSVALSSTSAGAQIYYTTDGSTPAAGQGTTKLYSSSISVTTTGTLISAIAEVAGWLNSTVSTGTYTLQAPAASLTAPAAFSATVGTTSAAQAATLTNTGTASLTGITPTLGGANPTEFAIGTGSNACGSTLAAGASCSIYVTFTPAAAASYAATLSVADNAAGSPQTAPISGTGIAAVVVDFGLSATPGAQTVASGAAANYNVTVSTTGGSFTNAVTLSVTGLPAGATASFSPTSVTPGSAGGNSTLTIQTAVASAEAQRSLWPMAAPVLALILFVPFRRWRKAWPSKLLLLVAAVASLAGAVSLMGCGGGFALLQATQPTQTPKSYVLTITGTSGSDTHSTTVQLTVQ